MSLREGLEQSGSFEYHPPHRESVESVPEDDASPTFCDKKPWQKTTPRAKKKRAPKRFNVEEKSHRNIDSVRSTSNDQMTNGDKSSPPGAVSLVTGSWENKPLSKDDNEKGVEDTGEEPYETIIKATSSDLSLDRTPTSSPERQQTNEAVDHSTSPERIKEATTDSPNPTPMGPSTSRDTESSVFTGEETPKKSPDSISAPVTAKSRPTHDDIFRNDSRDETLAHLVQMVESNDILENGEHHPFVADESKGSLSEYSVVDDTAAAAARSSSHFHSASSGYLAEYEDADTSQGTFFQSATLSSGSGTFSALLENDDVDNRKMPFQQQSAAMLCSHDEFVTTGDDSEAASRNFAMEHRVFMKAALELLTQRERYTADVELNDKETIKSGPLKKASHLVRGIWKVKYAEVRRGLFSYYEDESKDSEVSTLVRKNIPLNAATCSCRAVKIQHKALSVNPGGAIFELKIEGGPKRLWMANTREERHAWIEAINTATLGRSVTRGESGIDHDAGKSGTVSDESPYKADLELYVSIRREIVLASSKEQYLWPLSELVGKKLNVPIQWIRRQMGGVEQANRAFHEETVSTGVNQLWKDLLRDSVLIDDELFVGNHGSGPERIIATLMRNIMGSDRTSPLSANAPESQKTKYYISESQALSYARDILLCGNRTRSGGDSYYCVNTLCKNPEQVVVVPSATEADPWQIHLSHIQPEKRGPGDTYYSLNELSGWLKTRSKPQKKWKKRYFVLSEGTLSYFEKALPRPRGLRGQIGVVEVAINVSTVSKTDASSRRRSSSSDADDDTQRYFIVSILDKDGKLDRQILFEDEKKFILWAHALEAYCVDDEQWQSRHSVGSVRAMFRALRDELIGSQDLYGNFVLGLKSLKNNSEELGLDSEEVNTCIATASKNGANGRATVLVSIEAATDYKVCTLDPQGDENEDTWATIRAVFLQNFRLSGGPNGRIVRGEELVQINLTSCQRISAKEPFAEQVSPLSRIKNELTRPLRVRRSMST